MDCDTKTKVIYTTQRLFLSHTSHTHTHTTPTVSKTKNKFLERGEKDISVPYHFLGDCTMLYIFPCSGTFTAICQELNKILTYLDSDIIVIIVQYIQIL